MRTATCINILITCVLASYCTAATYTVRPDGSGDFPTIQAAAEAASPGDVIELVDGVFSGEGNREIDLLGKAITVRSQSGSPEFCIIDCQSSDFARGFYLHSGETTATVIQNLTVRNPINSAVLCLHASATISDCVFLGAVDEGGGLSSGGGVDCHDSQAVIRGCRMRGASVYSGGGISCSESNITVEGVEICGNYTAYGGAISCYNSTLVITGSTLAGSYSDYGGAVYVVGSTVSLERCILWGNCAYSAGDEVYLDPTSRVSVTCCAYESDGIAGSGQFTVLDDQVLEDPRFCRSRPCMEEPGEDGDYTLNESSPCLPALSPCGDLIGVWGVGCSDPTAIRETTWGRIKGSYR